MSLGEDVDIVRGFARKLDIAFPLLLDKDGDSPRLFGLWGHPNTVMIDRQGKVIGLVRGERDWQSETARRLVGRLLAEATSTVEVATILTAPDAREGKQLTLRGRVLKATRGVFPNGRP